jgi:UDP-3-O-[3-hydroxymyristoyl] glucosamine N-acyltransferase
MVRMEAVIDFLVNLEGAGCLSVPSGFSINSKIQGVKQDWEAEKGDMAWISRKQVSRHPNRIKSFRGSMLICPAETPKEYWESSHVIVCRFPKLAIIKVIERLFGHLSETNWPKPGESPISGDVKIGRDVKLASGVVIGSGVILEDEVTIGPNIHT